MRTTETIPVGARIVNQRTPADFDRSEDALRRLFAPVSLPAHFKVDATLIDRYSGHTAVVVGVGQCKERNEVLYLQMEGFCGATAFTPGEAFFKRWIVLEPAMLKTKLLQEGDIFRTPSFAQVVPSSLTFTPFVGPVPVDVVALHSTIGLQTGTVMERNSDGKTFCVLGLTAHQLSAAGVQQGEVVLSLLDLVTNLPVEAEQGCEFTVTHLPPRDRLTPVEMNYKTLEYAPCPEKPEMPLQLTTEHRVHEHTMNLFDVDPDRCTAYFDVVPGNVVNSNHIVVGLRYADVAWNADRMVELWAVQIGHHDVAALPPNTSVTAISKKHFYQSVVQAPRQSLFRGMPSKSVKGIPFKVPKVSQNREDYTFTFQYLHRSRSAMYHDTKTAATEYSPALALGQRVQDDRHRYSTFIGIAVDADGVIEMMFEVDGVAGSGAYSAGTDLVLLEGEIVNVREGNYRRVIYEAQGKTPPIPIKPTQYYKMGKVAACATTVDTDPDKCLQYYGLRPGQRVDGRLTVIGLKDISEKIHMVFHEDGHDGATIFSNLVGFEVDLDTEVDIKMCDSSFVMDYAEKEVEEEFPVVPDTRFNASKDPGKNAIKMPVDTTPETVKHYFGIVPGQRLDSNSTCVGLTLNHNKVCLAGVVDANPAVGLYSSGQKVLVNVEEPLVPLDEIFIEVVPVQDEKTLVYSKKPEDPANPIEETFPAMVGTKTAFVSLVDANHERCKEYFGTVPGQRVNGNATVTGMKRERGTGLIELWALVDGSKGAGVYSEGTTLILDTVVKKVIPIRPPVPIPTGSYEEIAVPEVEQDESAYSCTVPFITQGGQKMLFDTKYMEAKHGWKFGERYQSIQGPYSTLIGVAKERSEGKFMCFWQMDHAAGPGIYRTGESLLRYPGSFHGYKPVQNSKTIKYEKVQQRPNMKIKPMVAHCLGTGDKTRMELLDADPVRCEAYFGFKAGDRIDRRATACGMKANPIGEVEMWCLVDGAKGAGVYRDGTMLEVEEGEQGPTISLTRTASSIISAPETKDDFIPTGPCELHLSNPIESAGFSTHQGVHDQALSAVASQALEKDETARAEVKKTLAQSGFPDPDATITRVLSYLSQQTPAVSWFKPFRVVGGKPVIEWMTEDISMRNVFEVGVGNGPKQLEERKNWESNTFARQYDNAAPQDRVKYGLLNIFNDPKGPQAPTDQFGDCFLVFSGVRDRTTVTPKETKEEQCPIASLSSGAGLSSVLAEFKNEADQLESLAKIAHGRLAFFVRLFVLSFSSPRLVMHLSA